MRRTKKLMAAVTVVFMLMTAVGCQPNNAESQSNTGIVSSGSGSVESMSSAESTDPSSPPASGETAEFCLGGDTATAQTVAVGDKLGEWTLGNLEISYDADKAISMLEATWQGEVTLKGVITRNGLVELGYDFTVSEQDYAKMPVYLAPMMSADKKQDMFMLSIPDELASTVELDFGEELSAVVTVSDYRFIFAYMTAPAGATVTKIELPHS